MEVKGRDLASGLPKTLPIRSEEIREALQEPLSSILESVRLTLERCPPELAADLVDRGIVMAGGGALLRGIDRLVPGAKLLEFDGMGHDLPAALVPRIVAAIADHCRPPK